jgi:hypothetical protein
VCIELEKATLFFNNNWGLYVCGTEMRQFYEFIVVYSKSHICKGMGPGFSFWVGVGFYESFKNMADLNKGLL